MNSQKGIGLIEVLVALMLLAIAVLGFTAMQMTAVKATDESLMRTRALSVMRGGAEMMRANPGGVANFRSVLNGATTSITVNHCQTTSTDNYCSVNDMAARDALALKQFAMENELSIRAEICPGTSTTQPLTCLIAAWGDTTATIGTASTDCIKTTGEYVAGASCFVMEAY